MDKRMKKHLASLTEAQRAKLAKTNCVVRWPGLSDKEAQERLSLIDRKYSGNATDEEASRLQKLQGRLSSRASQMVQDNS